MKNKILLKVITIVFAIVILFNMVFLIVDFFFYNIKTLPEGEFLFSSMSPNGEHTVKVFLVDAGNNLGKGIRGELFCVETGKTKNIYWSINEDNAFVGWVSDTVISINGSSVNIDDDPYDWRDFTLS